MDKVILLALLGTLILQASGRRGYKYDRDYVYGSNKRSAWETLKVKFDSDGRIIKEKENKDTYRPAKDKVDPNDVWGEYKPADANILRGKYQPVYQKPTRKNKPVDNDPDNTWLEYDSSEERSGNGGYDSWEDMQDDQENSGWFSDDEDDDRTFLSKEAQQNEIDYIENEMDYIEDDVEYNEDRIYDLEDDLTDDEKKIKKMQKKMKIMQEKMENLQKLVKGVQKERDNDLYDWDEVESKFEARPRRGKYYELKDVKGWQ